MRRNVKKDGGGRKVRRRRLRRNGIEKRMRTAKEK